MPFGLEWRSIALLAIAFAFFPPVIFFCSLPLLVLGRYLLREYDTVWGVGDAFYSGVLKRLGVRTRDDIYEEVRRDVVEQRKDRHGDKTESELFKEYILREDDPSERRDIEDELIARRECYLESNDFELVAELDENFFDRYKISSRRLIKGLVEQQAEKEGVE